MSLFKMLGRIIEIPDWTDEASCVGEWELFDDCQGLSNERITYLRDTCFNRCPVRQACLSDALKIEKDEEWVWTFRGGYTSGERQRILANGWDKDLYKQF